MANVKIDIAAEFTGNKAFRQAETASQKMEKSVAKLGKQLAGVFAASKLYAFGKASVKAFAEDEKAARSLALALANTGNAFAAVGVEKFIGDLQRATGVLDDNLRPAFRTLLTATGDVKKSQDGLALALDIAAGTGKDLGAVSMALAKAYGGQTTALSRLGAGLDKATLKTGDMDVILGQLTDKFKGQALAAAEGYSGSIAKLTVASQNAKEIIGKDLLDSMQMIAGKDGIGGAATAMESFATQIGNAIYGIGVLTTKIKSLPGADFIGRFLSAATQVSGLGALSKFGASSKAASAGTPAQSPGQRKAIDKANADALRLSKTKNSLTTIENNNIKEKLLLTAGEKALLELKKIFDLEGIQIQAALNGLLTEEERARVLGLKAINDSDGALALQALSALNAATATDVFAGAARAAAELLRTSYSAGLSSFKQSEFNSLSDSGNMITTNQGSTASSSMPNFLNYGTFGAGTFRQAEAATTNIQVNVAGSITTERDLVSAITEGIYNNQAAGIPISYTTAFR